MSQQYELTESPPPAAFQKMWEPLLKFNEAAVGNAAARTLAVLLKDLQRTSRSADFGRGRSGVLSTSTLCLSRRHCVEPELEHPCCGKQSRRPYAEDAERCGLILTPF